MVVTLHFLIQRLATDEPDDGVWARVMAMPPRKRKNFKTTLRNKNDTKTKVKFVDGKLKNYDLETRKFVDIVCSRDLAEKERTSGHVMVPCTFVGFTMSLAEELGDDRIRAIGFQMAQEANYTGNHYRNHTTKVSARIYGR